MKEIYPFYQYLIDMQFNAVFYECVYLGCIKIVHNEQN